MIVLCVLGCYAGRLAGTYPSGGGGRPLWRCRERRGAARGRRRGRRRANAWPCRPDGGEQSPPRTTSPAQLSTRVWTPSCKTHSKQLRLSPQPCRISSKVFTEPNFYAHVIITLGFATNARETLSSTYFV